MDERTMRVLVMQVLAIRAAADAILAVLTGGDDPAPPSPEPAEPVVGCQHLRRLSTATMSNPRAWMCRDCGEQED